MNQVVKIVLGVILVVAIAAGSFYGGMVYGQGQAQASVPVPGSDTSDWVASGQGMPAGMPQGMPGDAGQRGSRDAQGGMISGEIVSIDDDQLTLQDSSGKEIQVYVTDTTLIQKQADVTVADLEEGETVIVSGSQGTDGSITARMVQVSSMGSFGLPGNLPFSGQQPGADSGGSNP
ncbi:MAG: hypothetical protein JXA93_14810 [Anaerolineae bacterium]|nr:hypothetical protein [Anaerolineae bacterium]